MAAVTATLTASPPRLVTSLACIGASLSRSWSDLQFPGRRAHKRKPTAIRTVLRAGAPVPDPAGAVLGGRHDTRSRKKRPPRPPWSPRVAAPQATSSVSSEIPSSCSGWPRYSANLPARLGSLQDGAAGTRAHVHGKPLAADRLRLVVFDLLTTGGGAIRPRICGRRGSRKR